jgi:hypothetical protein
LPDPNVFRWYQSHKSWRGYKSLISNTIEPPINYAYYKYFHFFVFYPKLILLSVAIFPAERRQQGFPLLSGCFVLENIFLKTIHFSTLRRERLIKSLLKSTDCFSNLFLLNTQSKTECTLTTFPKIVPVIKLISCKIQSINTSADVTS